jgi:beta-N-acetylhexosaminidase
MEQKVLAALLLLLLPLSVSGEPWFWSQDGTSLSTEAIVDAMSTEELIGQTFMLGYADGFPEDSFLEFIKNYGIGGVKIFGWNTADLEEMAAGIAKMQEAAYASKYGIPLLVATDQEGGWVRHVKGDTTDTPGNLAIGASGLALDAYENGLLIGSELAVLGINMNFAPTVDVYTDPGADVIGPRAFSSDPVETAFLGLAYYRGLESAGVIATAKHFPGHGNTDVDSHGTLPIIHDTLETLWDRDLLPYRMLIPEGLPAIMSGHLSFPDITGDDMPATLSPTFLKQILREDLGFDGIVITDDMRMYGVLQNGMEIPEACTRALLAGNDMLLISRDFETQLEIFEYLVESAGEDPALRASLEESARRIIDTKRRYLAHRSPADLRPSPSQVETGLPDKLGQSALFDLACRSVTIIQPAAVPLPAQFVKKRGEGLLLIGQYASFVSEGTRRFPDAIIEKIPFSRISSSTIENLAALIEKASRTIFCLANDEGLAVLTELSAYAEKITIFSVLTPVYLRNLQWVQSAIATFGRSTESFRAGFAVLSGDYVPEGRIPIPLEARAY